MKKILVFIITVILAFGCLSACGTGAGPSGTDSSETSASGKETSGTDVSGKESYGTSASDSSEQKTEGRKIKIVATIFPEYDWVMNILGEDAANAEVSLLLDKGVDMHSFQPSAADILEISGCDMFIYVGGVSDEWAGAVLKEAVNKDITVVNLLELLGDTVREEEIIDGMQDEDHAHGDGEGREESDDHPHGDGEGREESDDHPHGDGEGHEDYDEHVWLSLRNASILVRGISEALQKIDPEHAETYKKNTSAYLEKLEALDKAFQENVSDSRVKTVLFGDRFPFRYLVDDYGLSYYAAFAGCSAETEASFETITFLSKKVDELSLGAVLTIEGNDHRIAETIIQNTKNKDQKILTLDSLQSVTSKDAQNGYTYLAAMGKNLEVLREALE
ncbi:MAG: zinc ABC transporter substrate-binding protein [Lachnospiraceae bacterium]|nr:zinc ABC transporter substrate-binding protein [Lachnospiraceae bacterium]